MRFKRSTLRYGETPQQVTPYQKAAQVWDERMGTARAQARNWRVVAFACLGISLVLAIGLLWLNRSSAAVPFVVEVDKNGTVRAVGPAAEAYKPSDAQIAYTLARFVENVRAISIDPIVVRQSWLRAYDFATERAAVTLSEYARENDPFANVGRITVSVEVQSVVHASDTSFQLRWTERTFENGATRDTKRWTAVLTIVITPPRTPELIRKNPLDIYVHAFNWSQDLSPERANEDASLSSRGLVSNARRLRQDGFGARDHIRPVRAQTSASQECAETAGRDRRSAKAVAAARPTQTITETRRGGAGHDVTKRSRRSGEQRGKARADACRLHQCHSCLSLCQRCALPALCRREKLVSVSAGDTVRWVVGDTTSGDGKDAHVHILVKPIAPDLTTNLIITTDRRTYHLELHATDKTYVASVSWTYPAASLVALKGTTDPSTAATGEPVPNAQDLKFRYRIEGDAPWKPVRVFDDGAKVYVQFPPGLKQGEAPPLFVIGGDGKPALVNYRVKGNTYIVDRLFAAAELRLGTAPQQVVRIVRTDAVWKERRE
jgi:type IV secretion system protein TrbF